MKSPYIYLLLLILFLSSSKSFAQNNPSQPANTEWPTIHTTAKPHTRWWWMGSDVDSSNLTYNLNTLSKAGIGGVEITPIYGVKGRESNYINYLSTQWMNMLSFTESEAKRLNMNVDMSMGTGWPFGGSEITMKDAASKAIFQEYVIKAGQHFSEKIIVNDEKQKNIASLCKLMAYMTSGEKFDITDKVSSDGTLSWTPSGNNGCTLIALFIGKTLQKVKRAAPGGEGYVLNHFDADAVKRYFEKFDNAFTKNNTSFPNCFFNDSYEVYGADWTSNFLNEFENRRGYKLQNHFPELLDKGRTEISVRVISDYRETIGDILKDNFSIPWTKWANSHGTKTRNQAHGSPANLIDIYASVDIPECESFGITNFDIPHLRKDSIKKDNDGDPTTLKYASSAAHISGKKYTSSETFTWLTEHFRTSLSQAKPEIDQMFTSGVNHVYFHGATYSPQNVAWPGWKFYASVDMSPTNSIWRDAPTFFEYIARVQSFLQEGEPDNDFLLYVPIYDIWAEPRDKYFMTFAIHGMREKLPKFYSAVDQIRKQGYDLDYISDHFIKSSTVEDGMIKTEGGAKYKALIMPAVKLIPVETLTQIKTLIEDGATVIFADQYPSDIPGLSNLANRKQMLKNLINQLPVIDNFDDATTHTLGKGRIIAGNQYEELLIFSSTKNEEFVSKFGGQLIRRKNNEGYHYFFAMLQNKPIDGWVTLGVDAQNAMLFDPLTGKRGKAALKTVDGKSQVYMQLEAGQSIILKTFANKDVDICNWEYYKSTNNTKQLSTGWKMEFVESEPHIQSKFNLQSLGSWTELKNDTLKKNMGTARYSISFNFQKQKSKEYKLCLGDVRESARVWINGTEVASLFSVPFEVNIASFLRNGNNLLEIDVTNLPANRIADYDRRGIQWRIFNDINFANIAYKNTLFDNWNTMPSGLIGPVYIKGLEYLNPSKSN